MKFWTRVEQAFKKKGLRLFEVVFGKSEILPEQLHHKKIRRILVIRQHDQLGDFLLSTPVLRALRQAFPEAFIAVMVRGYTEAVVRHNRYVDDVLVVQESGYRWTLKHLRQFWHQLRRGYDLTVVINTVSHSLTSDLLAWFSRAPYVLGPSHRVFPGTKRNFLYNLIAPFADDGRHQSEKNLDIVRYIKVDTSDLREHITLLSEEKRRAERRLREMGLDTRFPILGVHPGAGKIPNRWPVERFAEAASRFCRQHDWQCVLFHGPAETDLRDSFLERFQVPVFATNDLRELAAVFACLSLYLGNDTGTTHMAAAVGTPLIVIFGPTPSVEWKPWGEEFVALQGVNNRCDSVSVEEVVNALSSLSEKVKEDKKVYTEIPDK